MSTNSKTPATGGGAAEKNTTNQPTTASQSPTAKPAETSKPSAEPEKPNAQKSKVKQTVDILRKNKEMNELIDKLDSLNVAAKELDSLNFGTRNGADDLTITDGRNSFTTSNPVLLADCVEYLKVRVEKRTEEIEKQLFEVERS
jgi:aspartate oxidase